MGIDGSIKTSILRLGGGVVKTTKVSKKKKERDDKGYKVEASANADHYTTVDHISATISPGKKLKTFEFPSDVAVLIFDATTKLKVFKDTSISTGQDYVFDYVMAEVSSFLKLENAEAAFLCFDRGSPPNKDKEHEKRYEDVKLLDLNTFSDSESIIDDKKIILSDNWEGFTNHPKLKQELLYYVTQRIVEPVKESNIDPVFKSKKYTYIPPINKCLFLFGGTLIPPEKERKKRAPFIPSAELFYVINESVVTYAEHNGEQIPVSTQYTRNHGVFGQEGSGYSFESQQNLLEGEVSSLYFSKPYTSVGKNVMIMTVDGDVLIQNLMACKDRIDPHTGKFKNKVYIRLLIPSQGSKEYTDIDLNQMYTNLTNHPIFLRGGVTDPSLILAIASCLKKNDFFDGFAPYIGTVNDNTDDSCPFVLYTLLTYIEKFGNSLVSTDREDKEHDYSHVHVRVDESAFIEYVEHLYVVKWWPDASKKIKTKTINTESLKYDFTPHDVTREKLEVVKKYLETLSVAKKRFPSKDQIRVYARMLEWVLNYFYNSYRGYCIPPDPLLKIEGIPYYGWEMCANNLSIEGSKYSCKPAQRVSPYIDPKTTEGMSLKEILRLNLWDQNSIRISLSDIKPVKRTREEPDPIVSAAQLFDKHDKFLLQIEEEENSEPPTKKRKIVRAETVFPILAHTIEAKKTNTDKREWIQIKPKLMPHITPDIQLNPIDRSHLVKPFIKKQ